MRTIEKGMKCRSSEVVVSFQNTIFGNWISACVSTKKQAFVVKNQTYAYGSHCVIQPYKKSDNVSELDIFREYNDKFTGGMDKYKHKTGTFVMNSKSDAGDQLRIGMGNGSMLGGLDKELTFKPVSKKVYDHVKGAQMLFEYYDEIENKHNFLFGDHNAAEMRRASDMRYELKRKLNEITGLYC